MARIRTIKPDFFRHEGLYEAEVETGLPLRIAFAGIWTVADRDGRFRWKPRELKLDCMPYDDINFSRVLDALATRGFIVKYRHDGKEFGFVPSWQRHQAINARERKSDLPNPEKCETIQIDTSASATDEERVADASVARNDLARGEGKGREGKGNGREGKEKDALTTAAPLKVEIENQQPGPKTLEFELFERGKKILGDNAGGMIANLLKAKGSVAQARSAIEQASEKQNPREYIGAIIRKATGPPGGDHEDPRI